MRYISIWIGLLLFFCSCGEEEEFLIVPHIETPEELSIDVNSDGEIDFKTSTSRTVGDGPNYVSYGTSLTIMPVNSASNFLLRSRTKSDIFLLGGDTINSDDTTDNFWDVRGITYANKFIESTNDFELPERWEIYIENGTKSGIIGYKLEDDDLEPFLGWIKIEIDDNDGTINIIEMSTPMRAETLIIE